MLVINEKGNNYFKIYPDETIDFPKEEKEQILWSQNVYKNLKDNPKTEILFSQDNPKKGYKIVVAKLDDTKYFFQTIRLQAKVYSVSVFMSNLDTAENDYISIGKMLAENMGKIGTGYKKQIKDGVKYFVNGEIPPEDKRELPSSINTQPLS